ncbi:cysteine desulfurase family protein [Criibacterium bergeronii]|uniref:cysteine desulfurase n=1 Tax=Criibacterium bergeronii TaxID=1871336 RepID=A0A371INR5_9FIRM|nr:cysteine desulfurase family protein [Criibacterium bergeronii]MBS6062486.1 cysteine desulfurase [Peptostreptococcaceae bacterium]RDY22119.1 cysteine desulfurase [Criibacterium bergeronii]TRW27777.1 cysteine desulfurase [Criibacterium bergeronii]
MKNKIYLDNASTTKIDDDILDKVIDYIRQSYGNPSSLYKDGKEAKKIIENARIQVAKAIGAKENEIYFTSGGTEADNWILKQVLNSEKKALVTSKLEHHAILNTAEFLSKNGVSVKYLDVDKNGKVLSDKLEKMNSGEVSLVSIMYSNNEIGTIQDIKKLAELAHEKGAIFHTDAVQALGKIDIDVKRDGIDALSLSGHKIHAFKGIGALYVSDKIKITPQIFGGEQERGKRASTENVGGIMSLGLACEKINDEIENIDKIINLRDYFIKNVLENIDGVILTGDRVDRIANIASFCFKDVDSSLALILLDKEGISVSAGSACMSGSIEPSHVLQAIGVGNEYIKGSLRFSFSKYTTKEELDITLETLKKIIQKVR